jgi:hypothetical protein
MQMMLTFMALLATAATSPGQQAYDQVLELSAKAAKKLSPVQQEYFAKQIAEALSGKNQGVVSRVLTEIPAAVRDLESYNSNATLPEAHLQFLARRSREILEYNVNLPALSVADEQLLKNQIQVLKHHLEQVVDSSVMGSKAAEGRVQIKDVLLDSIDQSAGSIFNPHFKSPLPADSFARLTADLYKADSVLEPVKVDSIDGRDEMMALMNVRVDISSELEGLLKGASTYKESATLKDLRKAWIAATKATSSAAEAEDRLMARKRKWDEEFASDLADIQRRSGKRTAEPSKEREGPPAVTPAPAARPDPLPQEASSGRRFIAFAVIGAVGIILLALFLLRKKGAH